MLQIGSGKLFRDGVHHSTRLRGTLYSNLSIYRDVTVQTAAGTLTGVDSPRSLALGFEFDEHIEGDPATKGGALSWFVDHYAHDFAALVTFFLDVTCSPDIDLVRRLISGERGLATRTPANKLLRRVFDTGLQLTSQQASEFTEFVRQVIGLPRATFLEVMRAIRTYVTGLHRMADDLEVAYTLMVASVESLAQAFDPHQATWADYEARKRDSIDRALTDVDESASERVRLAILENEHLGLARKFKSFVVDNLPSGFYREHAGRVAPIGRQALLDGLGAAYVIRSSYVHRLQRLPERLAESTHYAETVRDERRTLLTFQGLTRVVRSVVLEFIRKQPFVEKEPHDYTREHPSISLGEWAADVWMTPEAIGNASGRAWLEGVLEQFAARMQSPNGAPMSDLWNGFRQLHKLLPNMKSEQRLPFLAAYFIFHVFVKREEFLENFDVLNEQYDELFNAPSIESILLHCLSGEAPRWSVQEQGVALDRHLARRSHDKGYHFPVLFDAAICMWTVERYRAEGDHDAARARLATAVENFPGMPALEQLEKEFDPDVEIDWWARLLPRTRDASPPPEPTPGEAPAS